MRKTIFAILTLALLSSPAFAEGFGTRDVAPTSTVVATGRTTVTTAGTRVVLNSSTTKIKKVIVTAETDNTGIIVVGGSAVVASLSTRQGTPLNAGESMVIYVDSLDKVYLDTTVNTDGVTYTYFR